MSVTGFYLDQSTLSNAEDIVYSKVRGVSGTLYTEGDACIVSTSTGGVTGGLLTQLASKTGYCNYVFLVMDTPRQQLRPAIFDQPDSLYEFMLTIPVSGNLVFNTQFPAATFDGTACNANTLTNTVVFTGAGATNDLTGGQVYINELGQQATILSDTVSSGVHTLVVAPAFSSAPTTGNTLRAVPWGPGYIGGVQFQSTNPQQGISVAVADKTGGHIMIYDVDLSKRVALVRFSQNNP